MPANRRQRLRRPVERQRGPRAAAEQDIGMLAAAPDQLDDVAAELVVDADRPHRLLALDDLVGRDDGLEVVDRVLVLEPREHRRFLLGRRIPEAAAGPGTGRAGPRASGKVPSWSTGFWVAIDQERRRQVERRAVDRDLPLGHRLQQCRLGPRAWPG